MTRPIIHVAAALFIAALLTPQLAQAQLVDQLAKQAEHQATKAGKQHARDAVTKTVAAADTAVTCAVANPLCTATTDSTASADSAVADDTVDASASTDAAPVARKGKKGGKKGKSAADSTGAPPSGGASMQPARNGRRQQAPADSTKPGKP